MHQTGPGSERTFERENKNNKENEGSEQCAPDVKPSRKHAPTLADTGDGILDVSPLSGAGEGRADFGLVTPVRSDASEGVVRGRASVMLPLLSGVLGRTWALPLHAPQGSALTKVGGSPPPPSPFPLPKTVL